MDSKFYLNLSSSSVFTIIAFVGNNLVLFILTRENFIENSFFRYMIVATLFDTFHVLTIWPSNFPDFFLVNSIDISCKLYAFLAIVSGLGSPWMNLLSSIDRYLSVKYPTKFKFRNEFKYQALAIFSICLAICSVNVPFFLFVNVGENGTGCVADTLDAGFYMNCLNLLMSTIIPCFFMLLSTGMIGYELIVLRRKTFGNLRHFHKEKRLVLTLFILNFFYMATSK